MPKINIRANSPYTHPLEHLAESAQRGRLVPVLSDFIVRESLLGGALTLARAWGDDIDFPAEGQPSLYEVADFASSFGRDPDQARSDYLDFIKAYLLHLAERPDWADLDSIKEARSDAPYRDFSALARQLSLLSKYDPAHRVLELLALLPCPVYLTTSYHTLLQDALERANRKPRTDFSRWHEGLVSLPSECDEGYWPTVAEPLVYHLFGLDRYPASIVLSEQDHIDFLRAVMKLRDPPSGAFPEYVRRALYEPVLLLGFTVDDLAFDMLRWCLFPAGTKSEKLFVYDYDEQPSPQDKYYVNTSLSTLGFSTYYADALSALERLSRSA